MNAAVDILHGATSAGQPRWWLVEEFFFAEDAELLFQAFDLAQVRKALNEAFDSAVLVADDADIAEHGQEAAVGAADFTFDAAFIEFAAKHWALVGEFAWVAALIAVEDVAGFAANAVVGEAGESFHHAVPSADVATCVHDHNAVGDGSEEDVSGKPVEVGQGVGASVHGCGTWCCRCVADVAVDSVACNIARKRAFVTMQATSFVLAACYQRTIVLAWKLI